jgi:hypothetical protein
MKDLSACARYTELQADAGCRCNPMHRAKSHIERGIDVECILHIHCG